MLKSLRISKVRVRREPYQLAPAPKYAVTLAARFDTGLEAAEFARRLLTLTEPANPPDESKSRPSAEPWSSKVAALQAASRAWPTPLGTSGAEAVLSELARSTERVATELLSSLTGCSLRDAKVALTGNLELKDALK